MELRKATLKDARETFEWAQDPLVRLNSFNSQPIIWENHLEWFTSRLSSTSNYTLLAIENTDNIGLLRFDLKNDVYLIGITVNADFRGKGYSSKIIQSGLIFLTSDSKKKSSMVEAWIKESNMASIRSFESAGFVFNRFHKDNSVKTLIYIYEIQ
jgi:RimJ/RimL family protein N-acetyltransferase